MKMTILYDVVINKSPNYISSPNDEKKFICISPIHLYYHDIQRSKWIELSFRQFNIFGVDMDNLQTTLLTKSKWTQYHKTTYVMY